MASLSARPFAWHPDVPSAFTRASKKLAHRFRHTRVPGLTMPDHSEHIFYLIDYDGARRVPIQIKAGDGRYGYALHPKGKGNDAAAAEYTTDEKRLVQAVVLEGRGVRCRAEGGPHDGQRNTLSLFGRAIRTYWLHPDRQHWVDAMSTTTSTSHAAPTPSPSPPPPSHRDQTPKRKVLSTTTPAARSATTKTYNNHQPISFAAYCCQGGKRGLAQGPFTLDDLTIAEEGVRRLRFAPLGNRPAHPIVALVGITPGAQIEQFASKLAVMDVHRAAQQAAFQGAQAQIKALLDAHGLAKHMRLSLDGDLNDNPDILTTSIVKCCLMVDDVYRFSAPDIAASPAASHCATRRFVDELMSYPTLRWVIVFGESGWNALHDLRRDGKPLIDVLRDAGLQVLQLPHFAQNFQQRALFCCPPEAEATLLAQKPDYEKFAPAARRMREVVRQMLASQIQQTST